MKNETKIVAIARAWASASMNHSITIAEIARQLAASVKGERITLTLFEYLHGVLEQAALEVGYNEETARKKPYRLLGYAGIVSPSARGKGKKGKKAKTTEDNTTEIVKLEREAFLSEVGAKFDALDSAGMLALAQSFVKFAKANSTK